MFQIAHISDIHLGPMPAVKMRDLINKRITGYLNWKLYRKGAMHDDVLGGLIAHMLAAKPDHIALTGDLVNLALDEEITRMSTWLQDLGTPDFVSIIPGNHDTYVPMRMKIIKQAWQAYMSGDNQQQAHFPYRRTRQNVCLIGVNSGKASLPLMATGHFDEAQARAVETMLHQAKQEGKFRIIMIHHPPFANATSWHKRLIGAERFRAVIKRAGAELVLHGHTHIDSFQTIEGPHAPVAVLGVPSASKAPAQQSDNHTTKKHSHPAARYNLINISGQDGDWQCTYTEYGYSQKGTPIQALNQGIIL